MKLSSILTLAIGALVSARLYPDSDTGLYARGYDDSDDEYVGSWLAARSEENKLEALIARHEDALEFLYEKRANSPPKCERCGYRTAYKGSRLCGACNSALKTSYDPRPIAPKPAGHH